MKSFAVLALASLASAQSQKWSIDAATRSFRDEQNRFRIFHGFNTVLKKPDYLPIEDHFDFDMSLTDADFQYMKEWGTKLIRLGVMWESVETSPGSYDMDYLDKVESLINKFGDAGIAVIVDNHQDLFSRQLCGEGVPYFYTPTDIDHECPSTLLGFFFQLAGRCESLQSYNMETDENGNPLFSECLQHSFEDMYTAPEVASAFDALYSNQDGLLDKMMDFWRVVSNRFKSNPNVIGYDIINEPWPANIYKEQSLFFEPTKFDTERLYPIAQRAHSVVREADDTHAIFFEAAQFPDTQPFLGGITLPIGFPETPGGIDYLNRQALNDHTYCCQAAGWMCNNGEPPLDQSSTCRDFHQQKVDARLADAERFGVPMIFSEFGACFDGAECATEITNSVDAFDTALSSWAYWQYKSFQDFTTTGGTKEGMFNEDGTPQSMKLQAIARTYGYAYQGVPSSMFFSTQDASFTTTFDFDATISAPTEIYLHKDLFYPNGYKLTVSNATEVIAPTVQTTEGDNWLSLQADDSQNGQTLTVLLTQETADVTASDVSTLFPVWDGDYSITSQAETTAQCSFTFHQCIDSSGYDLIFRLTQRDGTTVEMPLDDTVNTFQCADLINSSLTLVNPFSGRFTPDTVFGTMTLPPLNGHDVSITIKEPHLQSLCRY